jgi:hypothetical protein
MTTAALVRAAWNTAVWSNISAQNITPNIYNYDITLDSTKEISKLRYNQEINFITYITTRAQTIRMMSQVEQRVIVEIRYYLEADIEGLNFNEAVTAFETIDGLVINQLGTSWSSTVDYYEIQEGPPAISRISIENLPVWLGVYRYTGFKNI